MTREEHLKWCKKRALEYLDRGNVSNAIIQMMYSSVLIQLGFIAAMSGDVNEARRFIVGFN